MESNHVRDLMEAYSSIYAENEEVEQLDEDFQGAVKDALEAGVRETNKFMKTPVGKVIRPFVSPVGKGQGTVTADQQKAKIKPVGEEVENWVNSLIDEGYDLSEYTWDDMCEMYMNLDEANRGENKTRMSNVSKLKRRQKNFAAGIVHPDEAGELEGQRQDAHKSKRYVPTRGSGVREGYDTFDIIKGHLLDEGFADTEEAALAIMTNMSEDWKESIVEGMFGSLPKSTTVIPGKYGKNTVLSKKGGVEGVSHKSKPGSFTPQNGGFDKMDAERYATQHSKQGTSSGTSGINLARRRETSGRVK